MSKSNVVYLIGAGASHANIEGAHGVQGILMKHLREPLSDSVSNYVYGLLNVTDDKSHAGDSNEKRELGETLQDLVNEVITENVDFEHLITFLAESPSAKHRDFAAVLRRTFERVLRERLDEIEQTLGERRFELYAALLEIHRMKSHDEALRAIHTINYDEFIEDAIKHTYNTEVDFGVVVDTPDVVGPGFPVLKLHGSFGWKDSWPIGRFENDGTLWIPPGIQKNKDRYPFNFVWGRAREMLDCDTLRIVGCTLSGSDWDLISLLFTTRVTNESKQPYRVEVIDSPKHADRLKEQYPYLDIRSILEIENLNLGEKFVARLTSSTEKALEDLDTKERTRLDQALDRGDNWFRLFIEQYGEALTADKGIEITEDSEPTLSRILASSS